MQVARNQRTLRSQRAAQLGCLGLVHSTDISNLPSILKAKALRPRAKLGPEVPGGGLATRVYLDAKFSQRQPGDPINIMVRERHVDWVALVFSNVLLDRNDFRASPNWDYGDDPIRPNGLLRSMRRDFDDWADCNEITFPSVPLTHLREILVRPKHRRYVKGLLEKHGVSPPTGKTLDEMIVSVPHPARPARRTSTIFSDSFVAISKT